MSTNRLVWAALALIALPHCSELSMKSRQSIEPTKTTTTPSTPSTTTELRMVGSAPGAILLTPREYDAALKVVLGDTSGAGRTLPNQVTPTTSYPFDNLWEQTQVTGSKVDTYEQLAADVTTAFLADAPRMRAVLPCIPTAAGDRACLQQIVTRMGLLALRRPLTDTERDTYVETCAQFATETGDPKMGIEVVLRALLQHPDFLFRWEIGAPLDARKTLFTLDDYALASKLAFTLWGEPPSLALLDAAAAGTLSTTNGRATVVDGMLADPRTASHLALFHAQWLGYSAASTEGALHDRLRTEAAAMIRRIVIDENRPWADLVTLDETWLDADLATHYGLSTPNPAGAWVKQPDALRVGLFGTGAFLSSAAGLADTSTTRRGYHVRKNLFCEVIPPPPANVDKDAPLGDPSNCKETNVRNRLLNPQAICVQCHQKMDPIGFGLERYSLTGRYREAQPSAAECALSGQGNAAGYGTFTGPTQLAKLALDSGRLEYCLVQRWVQFTARRKGDPNLDALTRAALDSFRVDGKLKPFIRRYVLSDSFRMRSALEQ